MEIKQQEVIEKDESDKFFFKLYHNLLMVIRTLKNSQCPQLTPKENLPIMPF